jgi:hypothetical protein
MVFKTPAARLHHALSRSAVLFGFARAALVAKFSSAAITIKDAIISAKCN